LIAVLSSRYFGMSDPTMQASGTSPPFWMIRSHALSKSPTIDVPAVAQSPDLVSVFAAARLVSICSSL
jgi:hypothetical protein